MSTTRRSVILRTRKNSEAEHDNRCRKRKKLASSSSETACENKIKVDNDSLTSDGAGNLKLTCRATKENDSSLASLLNPVTPVHNQRLACSFTVPNHLNDPSPASTPLPPLNWADPEEFWAVLKEKEHAYPKNGTYMDQHSGLQPKMRTILLDWLIEVCEVYRLHRETYHLAVTYIDRYLLAKQNVPKSRLQLVGVTALFIAAKLEEIYPPKLSEFSYVTDGACTDDEILLEELVMLKTLNWRLTPMTLNTWLRVYLQLANYQQQGSSEFLVPIFCGKELVQVAQLLDLCILDLESLQFSNRVLAAAALYHTIPVNICKIAAISWDEMSACVQWMRPFSAVVKEQDTVNIRIFDKVAMEDCANIQTHGNSLALLSKAIAKKNDYMTMPLSRHSPPSPALGVLTPPSSTKKAKKAVS